MSRNGQIIATFIHQFALYTKSLSAIIGGNPGDSLLDFPVFELSYDGKYVNLYFPIENYEAFNDQRLKFIDFMANEAPKLIEEIS